VYQFLFEYSILVISCFKNYINKTNKKALNEMENVNMPHVRFESK